MANQFLALCCNDISHVRCLNLIRFLLQILCSLWLGEKCFRKRWKKVLPVLVETGLLNWGVNDAMRSGLPQPHVFTRARPL